MLLGKTEAAQRVSSLNETVPEEGIASLIAEIGGNLFERRFDRRGTGNALLHQHGSHAGHMGCRLRGSDVIDVCQYVKPRCGKAGDRIKKCFHKIGMKCLLKYAARCGKATEGSTGGGHLDPRAAIRVVSMVLRAVDRRDGHGAAHARSDLCKHLRRVALLELIASCKGKEGALGYRVLDGVFDDRRTAIGGTRSTVGWPCAPEAQVEDFGAVVHGIPNPTRNRGI